MGTKVMVRATRSFNGYRDGDWYMVDPSDPSMASLIRGGYFAHQESLIDDTSETPTVVTDTSEPPVVVSEPVRIAPVVRDVRKRRGQVGAEPAQHPQDSPGEGPGAGDPDRPARSRRRQTDRPTP